MSSGRGRGRLSRRSLAAALVLLAIAVTVAMGVARRGDDDGARCGAGFVARGARCLVDPSRGCPAPLRPSPLGCDAPDVRVLIPEATVLLGPSDWEAEGRVAPRAIRAGPFRIDAFEVTERRWGGAAPGDAARAASGMTVDEAAAFCARSAPGGRLPTEDEWIVAAVAGTTPVPRYPWGETGAVCRRAAWGLGRGPCAAAADGPDTVGSHPAGDSALGLHDLAGNVAEWVVSAPSAGSSAATSAGPVAMAKGGSWASDLAADLRIWGRLELPGGARDSRVGLRCVYPP